MAEPSALTAARRPDPEGPASTLSARFLATGRAIDDPLLLCLVTLTELHGRPLSPQALTAGLPVPEDGRLTPDLAVRAAARAGLHARLLRRPLRRIDRLALPAILLEQDDGACVLTALDADGTATIALPETGRGIVRTSLAELERRYAGWALFAHPEAAARTEDSTAGGTRRGHWFWSTLLRQWPIYGEVALAAVLINLFALASPLFVMNVYDRVVPNNAVETLWVLAIGALTVFGFDFVLRVLRGYFVDTAGRIADIRLASRIFEQVLGMRMAVRPASAGAFASHLREFETLRDFFTSATITTLIDLPFVALFIGIVWLIAGPVAIVPAVAVPVVILLGLAIQVPLNRMVRHSLQEGARKHAILVESIAGLETVRSVGAEGRMQALWERSVGAAAATANRSRLLSSITVNLAVVAANLVTVGVVVVGVYEIAAGRLTVGGLVACSILAGRAMAPLGQVAQMLARLSQSRTAYRTLDQLMRLPVERPAESRFLHRPVLRGDIEFRNVTFSYPEQAVPALAGVSFRLGAGEKVALIGRIGSGKSTVQKLLLGLYQPDGGSILVDGCDLRQIDPADLRRNIGCVPQDVMLFTGSLRDNIAAGRPQADDAAVLEAARLAGVDDFAARHPQGYDLQVGERGQVLSGGQRQAVALARALLGQPPILVLDEPSSAMDNGGEAALKGRLADELAGRTLLLVTHRASLLSLVDRLIVLDGGRVVADGPKEQVLKALAAGQVRGDA
ncbi:MAG: type I secretion system permease/ATPase [Geminicoccaceae bacterium]